MISLLKQMLIAVERRSTRQFLIVCAAVIVLLLGLPTSVEADNRMYWVDAGLSTIQRANLDGTGVEALVTGLHQPAGIALDVAASKMYWSETGTSLKIRRANFDGTGVEDLLGSVGASAIALDLAAGKMYWTDFLITNMIHRANLDGTGVEELVTLGADRRGIALDVAGGKMYWTNRSHDIIGRANLDGTSMETLVTGLANPHKIALDIHAGKMYWTHLFSPALIQRANLDGTGVETLVMVLGAPTGIALDPVAGKMYWTEIESSLQVRRANLDGTGVEDLVTGPQSRPLGIALEIEVTTDVDIDIKPGKTPNSINPVSMQEIPVAVLTTDTFDATQVDPMNVVFGPSGATESHGRSHVMDVDEDGDVDVILHFNTQETGLVCGDTDATLSGTTFGGDAFTGTDSVKTAGCK